MLHKFLWEVEELPCDEYDKWMRYLKQKSDDDKKAAKKAARKSKRGR